MAPGARCAAILLSMDLPLDSVVDGLVQELGLTVDEAMAAAIDAMTRVEPKPRESSRAVDCESCARL